MCKTMAFEFRQTSFFAKEEVHKTAIRNPNRMWMPTGSAVDAE